MYLGARFRTRRLSGSLDGLPHEIAATVRTILVPEEMSDVLFSNGELRWKRSSWSRRRGHLDEGETSAGIAFCRASDAFRHPPVHRGICLVGIGWNAFAGCNPQYGRGLHVYAQGLLPFLLPLSVLLFEPDGKSRRSMLPFLVIGVGTGLYILWALAAYPTEIYVRQNSIVYINQATNNTAVAILYLIATCGALFFSKVRAMVVFGAANLAILLIVTAVKRYAFTSVWCAYAAVASVIVLVYFWKTTSKRPLLYAHSSWG
jgi:hypothetical protein